MTLDKTYEQGLNSDRAFRRRVGAVGASAIFGIYAGVALATEFGHPHQRGHPEDLVYLLGGPAVAILLNMVWHHWLSAAVYNYRFRRAARRTK